MANASPNLATRFKKGVKPPGTGRPAGSRDRLSTAFLKELADNFEKHGKITLEALRQADPATYIRVVASLQPKEIDLKQPLSALSDGKLEAAVLALTEALKTQAPPPAPIEEIQPSITH